MKLLVILTFDNLMMVNQIFTLNDSFYHIRLYAQFNTLNCFPHTFYHIVFPLFDFNDQNSIQFTRFQDIVTQKFQLKIIFLALKAY